MENINAKESSPGKTHRNRTSVELMEGDACWEDLLMKILMNVPYIYIYTMQEIIIQIY